MVSATAAPGPAPDAPAFPEVGIRVVGRLVGLFSFDIGAEIDLDRVRTLLPAAEADRTAKRAAPPSLGYTTPPLRAGLGDWPVRLGDTVVQATASMVVHEVGALTIVLTTPLACDVAALPGLTATLTGAGPLEDVARTLAEAQRARLAAAITKEATSDVVEDYYVIQADRLDP